MANVIAFGITLTLGVIFPVARATPFTFKRFNLEDHVKGRFVNGKLSKLRGVDEAEVKDDEWKTGKVIKCLERAFQKTKYTVEWNNDQTVTSVVTKYYLQAGKVEVCTICQEDIGEGEPFYTLPCKDVFHEKCMKLNLDNGERVEDNVMRNNGRYIADDGTQRLYDLRERSQKCPNCNDARAKWTKCSTCEKWSFTSKNPDVSDKKCNCPHGSLSRTLTHAQGVARGEVPPASPLRSSVRRGGFSARHLFLPEVDHMNALVAAGKADEYKRYWGGLQERYRQPGCWKELEEWFVEYEEIVDRQIIQFAEENIQRAQENHRIQWQMINERLQTECVKELNHLTPKVLSGTIKMTTHHWMLVITKWDKKFKEEGADGNDIRNAPVVKVARKALMQAVRKMKSPCASS